MVSLARDRTRCYKCAAVRDETFMTLMRLLPKSALSTAVGMATRAPAPRFLHRAAIRAFARKYQVDVAEAERALDEYPTFAEFFTRRLKPGLRPIDPDPQAIVSPVDGAVSQAGTIEEGRCLQAKGIHYPVEKLLAEDAATAAPFLGGAFATLYLSPRDYHRIHAPIAGTIDGWSYVPGEFWPVNPASVRSKQALFCVNERLTTWLSTPAGRVAVVAVGATNVARIRASYDDILTHTGKPARRHRYERPIPIGKGDELGVFEMGSTVILLFETGRVRWSDALRPDAPVRLGQRVGTFETPSPSA